MRSRLGRSLSIALALTLTALLTPGGNNVTEAEGGKPLLWQVAIPEDLDGRNLAGFSSLSESGFAVFEDEGAFGSVRVSVSRNKSGRDIGYSFTLILEPGMAEAGYGVQIGGVDFAEHSVTDGEAWCQVGQECGMEAPDCLECFLNGIHPYSVYDPGYGFALQVATDEDAGSQMEVGGRLFLFMNDYNDELGQYHHVECSSPRKAVSILQSGPDEWTLVNGSYGGDTYLTCEEYYNQPIGTGKGPGHRAKYEKRLVMTATTLDPFVFETVWSGK